MGLKYALKRATDGVALFFPPTESQRGQSQISRRLQSRTKSTNMIRSFPDMFVRTSCIFLAMICGHPITKEIKYFPGKIGMWRDKPKRGLIGVKTMSNSLQNVT